MTPLKRPAGSSQQSQVTNRLGDACLPGGLLTTVLLLLLQVSDKKTTFKVNYLTATKSINGEVISQLAANKKATVAFNDKQVR